MISTVVLFLDNVRLYPSLRHQGFSHAGCITFPLVLAGDECHAYDV